MDKITSATAPTDNELAADALMRQASHHLLDLEGGGLFGLSQHERLAMTPGQMFKYRMGLVRLARRQIGLAGRMMNNKRSLRQ